MQAVTLTAEALQEDKGDAVLLEEFSYPGTLSAYRSLQLDLVCIHLDEGGMRIDHMEEELERLAGEGRKPKFIYAISTYQNPTGFNMPRERRAQMIELAARYDVPIVEDNCYADVHYEGEMVLVIGRRARDVPEDRAAVDAHIFGVTAGNMDSMVNRYTADRKIRRDDAYTPDGEGGRRPDRCATVYAQRLREAYPQSEIPAARR